MPAPFDPRRYKNRESARKAAERYARLGRTDRAHAIRDAWDFPVRTDWPYGPRPVGSYTPDPRTSGDLIFPRTASRRVDLTQPLHPPRYYPTPSSHIGGGWDALVPPPLPAQLPPASPDNPYTALLDHPRLALNLWRVIHDRW